MIKTATIANGTSLSAAIDMGVMSRPRGLIMPAGWDAAAITFQVSNDGITFQNLYDDAAEVSVAAAGASRTIGFKYDLRNILMRWQYLKIRSGPAAGPVNQTAQRDIQVACAGNELT